jgi:hypothetical protein
MTCTDLCFFLQQRYCKSLLLIVIQTQEKRDIWALPVSHITLVFKETCAIVIIRIFSCAVCDSVLHFPFHVFPSQTCRLAVVDAL